jgi:NAD(P)-dependent dehydrogenase (short-subunit alcohol dehydrogenase family)
MHTVLVLGGYGNFGQPICRALAREPAICLLIGGRDPAKARAFAQEVAGDTAAGIRIDHAAPDFADALVRHGVNTVVHTAGPFQGKDYDVARACIRAGCHYIDLADAREFVAGIGRLDHEARAGNLLVVSGASSVPGLSSAVVNRFLPEFGQLHSIRHGISTGAKTPGIATMRAVLSYCGKPFRRLEHGAWTVTHGWQDLQRVDFPAPVGKRWFGSCDVPDLELFPKHYPTVRTVTFHAGLGMTASHVTTWLLSWAVRAGLIRNLVALAPALHWLSRKAEPIGSAYSAMRVELSGLDRAGAPMKRLWFLIAGSDHGPRIPCGAAIVLASKLAEGGLELRGAVPCVGLITLDEYLGTLAGLDIRHQTVSVE